MRAAARLTFAPAAQSSAILALPMSDLLPVPRAEARKKGTTAVVAWAATGLFFWWSWTFLWLAGAAGAGWLTWRWLQFRGKWGLRF